MTPACPNCQVLLSFPTDQHVRAKCPACGSSMEWTPEAGFLWHSAPASTSPPAPSASAQATAGVASGAAPQATTGTPAVAPVTGSKLRTVWLYVLLVVITSWLAGVGFGGVPASRPYAMISDALNVSGEAAGGLWVTAVLILWGIAGGSGVGLSFILVLVGSILFQGPVWERPLILAVACAAVAGGLFTLRSRGVGRLGTVIFAVTLFAGPMVRGLGPQAVVPLLPEQYEARARAQMSEATDLVQAGRVDEAIDTLAGAAVSASNSGDLDLLEAILDQQIQLAR